MPRVTPLLVLRRVFLVAPVNHLTGRVMAAVGPHGRRESGRKIQMRLKRVEPGGCDGLPYAGEHPRTQSGRISALRPRQTYRCVFPPRTPGTVRDPAATMPTGTANKHKAAPPEVIAARPAGHCVYLAIALIPSCCPCGVRYTPVFMVSHNAMFVNDVMKIFTIGP